MAAMNLVLASSSRYRRELLARLQIPFVSDSPDIDETPRTGETPIDLARRLAREKAAHVRARHPDALVIGSDQVATIDDVVPMNKPGTFERAREQLAASSGREVRFHTAWCVLAPGDREWAGVDTVHVRYRTLSMAEIERYLRLEEPYDCAGSARCETLGITLLDAIRSDDPTALIGLPVIAVARALREAGLDPLAAAAGPGKS